MRVSEALEARVKALARELGFARVGIARAEALEPEGAQLRAFVAKGRHGGMGWLADTVEVRADPRHPGMVPGAESVVVLVAPYARPGGEARVGPAPGRVARYARERDYHNVLRKKVRKIEALLREAGHRARWSVDSRPVLERAWAERAGVGFVGKNCCLIVPGLGSHVFLATVVTTARLEADAPMARRCGACRLCLDRCPTEAFAGPRELDARRCVSYLTIEHEGPVDPALREGLEDWIFGCDACQDVCPYNRTAPPEPSVTEPYAAHGRWEAVDAEGLLAMEEEAFLAWAEGSPARRSGRTRMARNAAYVLGNVGERRHLPVLREAARGHEDEGVREAARWAGERIEERGEE